MVPWSLFLSVPMCVAYASSAGTFTASISKPTITTETESTEKFMGEVHPQKRFHVSEMPKLAAQVMEGIVETFLQKQQLPENEVKCLEDGTRQMAEDVLLVGSHVVMFTQELVGAREALPELGRFPSTTTPNQAWLKEKGLMAERRLDKEEDSPNFLMDASAVVMELGLSMQKVAALSHQILHTCLRNDGLEALKLATEHAINVTYVTQRVFLNGADVCSELADGVEKWNADDREGFGRAIGTALRKLVLSKVNSQEIQDLPNASVLVNITDTFLESFFGPGIALHVKSFEGKNTTDDFRINLHSCFGQNADLVKKMWASTMEVFRVQAQKKLHEATGESQEKEDDDLKKTLTYDMMQIPVALSRCDLDEDRQQMMKDAFMGLSDGTLSLTLDTPRKVTTYSLEDHLARAVECWREIANDGGISFGHALGKLFQDAASLAFPQKYLVDDLGRLQLRVEDTSRWFQLAVASGLSCTVGLVFLVLAVRRARRDGSPNVLEAEMSSLVDIVDLTA